MGYGPPVALIAPVSLLAVDVSDFTFAALWWRGEFRIQRWFAFVLGHWFLLSWRRSPFELPTSLDAIWTVLLPMIR